MGEEPLRFQSDTGFNLELYGLSATLPVGTRHFIIAPVSVNDFVRLAKGRSSRKTQQEFEQIRKRYWGERFWGGDYFSTISGNITDDIIMRYPDRHTHNDGFSLHMILPAPDRQPPICAGPGD